MVKCTHLNQHTSLDLIINCERPLLNFLHRRQMRHLILNDSVTPSKVSLRKKKKTIMAFEICKQWFEGLNENGVKNSKKKFLSYFFFW